MRQSALFLLVVLSAIAPVMAQGLFDGLFQAFFFLPSIVINFFFEDLFQPITDELCFDFVKQFQLQDKATCECTGGINSNLGFRGEGVCTIPNEVCFDDPSTTGVCGEVKIYPEVVTERINVFTVIFGDVADAIDDFELSARTVLGDDLVVIEIETVGSVAQCLVEITSLRAQASGQDCTSRRLPFAENAATCENNENIPKEFELTCPGFNPGVAVDITLQPVTT